MTNSRSAAEVLVIGGGPAGATVATVAARAGHRVRLLDRAEGPRFKVGESLMPATFWTLDRLGVLERMRESAFPKKYSVQFFGPDGRGFAPFYFRDADPHESSQTWQVARRDFDALLLETAAEAGVEVEWGRTVRKVLFDGESARGVELAADAGGSEELAARVVVDASGQRALVARQLGLLEVDPCLRHAACFTHFEGARRDDGIDEGATLIFHTVDQRSWFWFIPLPGERASVGVVGSVDHLVRDRDEGPQGIFAAELARCPALAERLEGARQAMPMKVARDFSYRSRRAAGEGWVLVGDAYGFIDPIYSSGVFLALKSGEMAGDAVVAGLAAGDLSGERLGAWEDVYREAMAALKRVVYAFYDPGFSFARFLERYPDRRDDVIQVLTGNVFGRSSDGLVADLDRFQGWSDDDAPEADLPAAAGSPA